MSRASLLVFAVAGLLTTSLWGAEPTAGFRSFDTVTKVAVVTARDGSGRAQRFTDTGNREFAVKYDTQQRLQAVEATHGPHISDIVSMGYAPDGRLVGVKFRSGYMVFFDNRPDGTQVMRDSRGGAVIRSGRTMQSIDAAAAEQSAKLASAVSDLEALLSALGQPLR